MVGQQERSMVARSPPLRSASELQGNVPVGQLQARLAEIDILIVEFSQRTDGRSKSQSVPVGDEFRLHPRRQPISCLEPTKYVGLILHAVRVIFTVTIFAKANTLMPAERKGINLGIHPSAIPKIGRLFRALAGDGSTIHEFRPEFGHEALQ